MTRKGHSPESNANPRRFGMLRLVLIAAGLLAILGVLLFVGASFWVNQAGSIPAELLEPPKELTAALPPSTETARTRTIKRPLIPPGPSAAQAPRTYDDIVRTAMRAHPEQAPQLQTYLDLNIFKDFKAYEQFIAPFEITTKNARGGYDVTIWKPGDPQTLEQAAWLKEHAPLLDSLQHLYEGGMLPLAEYDPDRPEGTPGPDFAPLYNGANLLAAEARRRADLGDSEGALRPVRAILSLAGRLRRHPGWIWFAYPQTALGERMLVELIEHLTLTDAQMKSLGRELARFHREHYPAETLAQIWEEDVRISRSGYIQVLNQPWNTGFFGYSNNPPTFDIDMGRYLYIPNLPRLDLKALSALRAMDHKRAAPRYLKELDNFSLKVLERYRLTYPEMLAAGPVTYPAGNLIFKSRGDDHFDIPGYLVQRVLTGETHLNLARTALEWKLGRRKAVPLTPETDMRRDRENPWRDPFAEQPLKVNKTTTATLIYSVGPDLKDEQGKLNYEPRIEVTPGDLVIRLENEKGA